MYVDDDAFVYHFDQSIEYWLKKFPTKDLIIGEEQNKKRVTTNIPYVNTGVFICRNTKWIYQLFYDILNDPLCYRDKSKLAPRHQDQPCLQNLLCKKHKDFKKHIGIISVCDFNCNNTLPKWYNILGYLTNTSCDESKCDPYVYHHFNSSKRTAQSVSEIARQFINVNNL